MTNLPLVPNYFSLVFGEVIQYENLIALRKFLAIYFKLLYFIFKFIYSDLSL
jgi:hypothetical protein